MIKLDIINEVVNRTGITKTKAEMAVETVFESMKRSLERGERIELIHRASNRDIFAGGALHVARAIADRQPGRYRVADLI